ncbi:MAG TPA: helix-turn-helix domain-containing protein [Candidatus Dormibacteraeota bacterium]|nr:helix-turn-helix domain-containing protein [Candidatus Dormibacteraeota bacterium]
MTLGRPSPINCRLADVPQLKPEARSRRDGLESTEPVDGPLQRPTRRSLRLLASLAASLAARLEEITDRTVEAICEREEGYREGRLVSMEELRRTVHDSLAEYLGVLTRLPEEQEPARDQAWAVGRSRAELGVPLESVLRAYRLGGSVIWDELLKEARRRPERPTDDLMEAAELVWQMTDELSSAVGVAYRHSEAGLISRDRNRRESLLQGLLSGIASERDLVFAAETLGLPEHGPYLVAVAEPARDGEQMQRLMTAGGVRSAWLLQGGRQSGLLAAARGGTGLVQKCLGRMVPIRAGLSPEVSSLSDVGGAYRQAELALRSIPAHRHAVVTLDERLPAALLVVSPDLARRLAHRVLGKLLEIDRGERAALLRTLRLFLAGDGSVVQVAAQVPCHRNTVLNRLHRIRELTGVNPTTPAGVTDLTLALEAAELLSLLD